MDKIKTISEILEEIIKEICDQYCKYGEQIHHANVTDEEYDAFMAKYCDNCPFNRL